MRCAFVFIFIFLGAIAADAQKAALYSDTIDIITLGKIDKGDNQIGSFSRYFGIKNKIYSANNFPFMSIKAHCPNPPDSASLYYTDFKEVINQKGIDKLTSVLSKQKYLTIDAFAAFSTESSNTGKEKVLDFVNCVHSNQIGDFVIAVKKITGVFLLLDCESEKGLGNIVFCPEKVYSSPTVVILNVVKIYN